MCEREICEHGKLKPTKRVAFERLFKEEGRVVHVEFDSRVEGYVGPANRKRPWHTALAFRPSDFNESRRLEVSDDGIADIMRHSSGFESKLFVPWKAVFVIRYFSDEPGARDDGYGPSWEGSMPPEVLKNMLATQQVH